MGHVVHLSVYILVILHGFCGVRGDFDLSICNLTSSETHSPPPALPESYTAHIEWKWLQQNATIDVTEIHAGIMNVTSQTIVQEGRKTQVLYDHQNGQYVVYEKGHPCMVKDLGTYEFLHNHMWLSELGLLYNIFKVNCELQPGEFKIRSIPVRLYQACLYLYQSNITVDMQIYFSASKGWKMALSNPNQMVPVQYVITGSVMHNDSDNGLELFTAIGDVVDFDPFPTPDASQLQLPAGAYCEGRKTGKPMDPLPISFSAVIEKIDIHREQITFEYIWYDHKRKLARRDYKGDSGNDPDPTSDVFDFNLGVHYSMNSRMGNCNSQTLLTKGDYFVVGTRSGSIRMQTTQEFFHAESFHNVQYVGLRTTRGVTCDVWVRRYLDPNTNKNFTAEWYFATPGWQEGVDVEVLPAALLRMDIWQAQSTLPIIHNIQQLNTIQPQLSTFNVQACYPSPRQTTIIVHFAVVNNGSLLTVSKRYLRDKLQTIVTAIPMIPLLRITDTKVTFSGKDLYFMATLLDKSPIVNMKLYNKTRHDINHAYDFLTGSISGGCPTINLTSTIHVPVQIKGLGIRRVDDPSVFSTTTSTTTMSTPEQTPTPPTHHPTTSRQVKPSEVTPPLPPLTTATKRTTRKSTKSHSLTTPTSVTKKPVTTSGTVGPRSGAVSSTTPCSTSAPCTCPRVTCPTVVVTQRPVTCPPPTQPPATRLVTQHKTTLPVTSVSPNTNHTPTADTLKNPPPSSGSGLSGGVVAAISITMVIVGIMIGVSLLLLYQRYAAKLRLDGRDTLTKYMDDDRKY